MGWVEREENVGAGLVSMAPQGSSSSSTNTTVSSGPLYNEGNDDTVFNNVGGIPKSETYSIHCTLRSWRTFEGT